MQSFLSIEKIKGDLFGRTVSAIIVLTLALTLVFYVSSGAGTLSGLYGAICVGFFFFAAVFAGAVGFGRTRATRSASRLSKPMVFHVFSLWLFFGLAGTVATSHGATIKIATASNFSPTMDRIIAAYKGNNNSDVVLSISGSSGKHYAQIIHGAPFDLFFSADKIRPQKLESLGYGVANTRFTYAIGQLVLVAQKHLSKKTWHDTLSDHQNRLTIANPKLAPYGEASRQILMSISLWDSYQNRLIMAENIVQTQHFLHNGGSEMALISYAQWLQKPSPNYRDYLIPPGYHAPIEQQAIMLRDQPSVRRFMEFVESKAAQAIIHQDGYLSLSLNSIP